MPGLLSGTRRSLLGGRIVAAPAPAWAPTDVSGLKTWLRGDLGTFQTSGGAAAAADGDPVGEWQDQGGAAQHYGQTTAGFRPTLKLAANGINGLAVVRFDGADDYLERTLTLGSNDHTIFAVLRRNGVAGGSYHSVFQMGMTSYVASGAQYFQLYNSPADDLLHGNYNTAALDVDDTVAQGTGAVYVVVTKANAGGGASVFRRGGASVDTGTGNQVIADGYSSIGSWNSNDFQGDVAELGVYDTVLSAGNLASLESYLATRYGL